MEPITSFQKPAENQSQSDFFTKLPGEVRDLIYQDALSSYEDLDNPYDLDTPYRRPGYLAPLKTDVALLQTCQRVYEEAWFRPWVNSRHTFWLAWNSRRPRGKGHLGRNEFQSRLLALYRQHGRVELDQVHIFSQLCNLGLARDLLIMQNFYPRTLTVTIRHHDFWMWEDDEPLRLDPHLVLYTYPDSLLELRIEIESLQRKKDQIDFLANAMVERWNFDRNDGVLMTAKPEDVEVGTWSGSSAWEGQRWICDESSPGKLDYYIKTVVWKPNRAVHFEDVFRETDTLTIYPTPSSQTSRDTVPLSSNVGAEDDFEDYFSDQYSTEGEEWSVQTPIT